MVDIKDIQGNLLLSAPITEGCRYRHALMEEEYVALSFELDRPMVFPEGAYIEHSGERFSLLEPYLPNWKNELAYSYAPQFQSPRMLWKKKILFYLEQEQTVRETNWSITDTLPNIGQLIIKNILDATGVQYTLSVDPSLTGAKSFTFQSTSIFDALNEVVKEGSGWSTEWWTKGLTLHLSRCRHGSELPLTVGENISVPGIKSPNDGYYTRFYAFGSTRNITQDYDMGSNTNHIVEKRLKLPSATYPNGYIDIRPGLSLQDTFVKTLYFEEIYPSSSLNIAEVRAEAKDLLDGNGQKIKVGEDSEGNPIYQTYSVWFFKLPGFTFDFNSLIPGLELSVRFLDGQLNGFEFQLIYHSNGEFEIIKDQSRGFIIPGQTSLFPNDGDAVVLFNLKLPDEYVASAEERLEQAAIGELERLQQNRNEYTFSSNPVAFARDGLDLLVGRSVLYHDGEVSLSTRVLSVEKKLNKPIEQTITIGEEKIPSSRQQLKEEVVNVNQTLNDYISFAELNKNLSNLYLRTQQQIAQNFALYGKMWYPVGSPIAYMTTDHEARLNSGFSLDEFFDLVDHYERDSSGSITGVHFKVGLSSKSYMTAIGIGSGGGSGGSSYLHDLLDVNGSIRNAAAGDLLSARLVNGNIQWTNVSPASIVPDLSGYAYASGANAYGTWNINILGNADTVDGKHAGDFSTMVRVSDWNSVTYKAGDVLVGSNTAASSPSGNYLTAIALPIDNNLGYVRLLGIDVYGTVWKRQQNGGSWGGWVNAADGGNAAQLNTTRYIFGQPFNGTGDVRGTLYNADSVVLVNGSVYGPGVIELFGATPYIDFHFGNSGTDYTSRIIEYTSGRLLISGSLDIGDTYGTNNRLYVSGNIGTNGRLNFTNSGNSVLTSPYQIYFYPNGASVAPENSAFVIASSAIFPGSTNAVDIGLSSHRFKDGWFTGNIVTNGNVGVGTASPLRKLHVEGAILAANNWLYTTGSTGWANSTYGGGIYMEDTIWVRVYGGKRFHVSNADTALNGNGDNAAIATLGGISAAKVIWAGGNVYANGAVTALSTGTSDLRLKEAIQPFDGLPLMESIGRAFAHRWNGQALSLNPQLSNAHVNHSWSAQRVAEVLPQYILHDLYGEGYLGINRDGLLPIVWNGVLEVSDEVTTLQRKVAALEREVSYLKQQLCQ